jgi:hypothetical protein
MSLVSSTGISLGGESPAFRTKGPTSACIDRMSVLDVCPHPASRTKRSGAHIRLGGSGSVRWPPICAVMGGSRVDGRTYLQVRTRRRGRGCRTLREMIKSVGFTIVNTMFQHMGGIDSLRSRVVLDTGSFLLYGA